MSEHQSQLHKEFELERLILFSDAVFAIAITLIIIEIKFPEVPKGASPMEVLHEFRPTIIQFLAFVISFVFIGLSWMRHLSICRYLTRYNNGLIKRNLVLLFFIVCFPFSASGITEHIRPGFMLPLLIYIFNIAAVSASQYFLCHYVFKTKPDLSVAGHNDEKKYLLLSSKSLAVVLAVALVLYVIFFMWFPRPWSLMVPTYSIPIMMVMMRRRLKKYKPASMD